MGNAVTIVDDLSTGSLKNVHPKAGFHQNCTTDRGAITKIFEKVKPEYIFQLAANTNVPRSVEDPIYDFKTLHGALNVIDCCRDARVKKFIYISSGFIYGNTGNRPIKETEPFIPLSPYGITKKTVEHYLSFYKEVYSLEYVVIRPATIYGPGQHGGALADYVRKLSANQQAEMYGDGEKTRDYVFVSDAVDAFITIAEPLPYKFGPIFNLGTGIETTLNELYATIGHILNKNPDPIYFPERSGELEKYSLDSSKLRQAYGWKPNVSLKDGLRLTLQHGGHI